MNKTKLFVIIGTDSLLATLLRFIHRSLTQSRRLF